MRRLSHGSSLLDDHAAPTDLTTENVAAGTVACPEITHFDYLFPELQNSPSDRLPTDPAIAQALIDLGATMTDPEPTELTTPAEPAFDSKIASVYSYFGQFITHEIVFESTTNKTPLSSDTVPLAREEIPNLKNARSALLDLDSIYGPILDDQSKCYPVPLNGAEMALGAAAGSSPGTDLLREKPPSFTAKIGDRRNDANLITSQLHVAFLRAHNALAKSENSFEGAQRLLRKYFQWLVIEDYLPKVVDADVLKLVKGGKIDMVGRLKDQHVMPLEFSVAAFRFGHSMARNRYNYNESYDKVRLSQLFLPRKSSYPPVIKEWIIDWSRFIPGGQNVARRIDTRLVQPLFHLIDSHGQPVTLSLAALDLLRGYLLGLPTGQAVAKALGAEVLTAAEIEGIAGTVKPQQRAILIDSGLSSNTPLWFYIVAEAAKQKDGLCLGEVGSTIVAGVLYELVRRSPDSILSEPKWSPPGDGTFDLTQLFKLAEVL